jgi:protease-4
MSDRKRLTLLAAMLFLAPVAFGDEPGDDGRSESNKESKDSKSPIKHLVQLKLDEYLIPARAFNLPMPGRTKTLQDVMTNLERWSEDEKVGAVLLNIGNLRLGLPDVQELRSGIQKLKDSDKKVMAFFTGSPNGYLLACAADEIVIAPTGSVMIPGMGSVFPWMKGHFQMLGVEYEVVTAGKFKYPGFMTEREPTEAFDQEYGAILDSWYNDYKKMIAEGRDMSMDDVQKLVNVGLFDANAALHNNLVDDLAYFDDYESRILKRQKFKRSRTLGDGRNLSNVTTFQDLFEVINDEWRKAAEAKSVGPKIAVLHARGPIIDQNLGSAFASQVICRDDFAGLVEKLRKNDSIKAVVMRVDSQGGSGYASDIIWKQLRELADEKPLVVSMGRVAGSGGYYIACPAHLIFAQPTTITGSIGVIAMHASQWSALNRADFNLSEMKRGDRSLFFSAHRPFTNDDRRFLENWIMDFYQVFLERVAVTRKMPVAEVDKVAQGRIYSGRDAKDVGLVDRLGGLEEAIDAARELANIPESAELKIVHYPRAASLGELFESFSMVGVSMDQAINAAMKGSANSQVSFVNQIKFFSTTPQPLCWLPVPELSDMFSAGLGMDMFNSRSPSEAKVLFDLE